jgi:hypothetical protein
MCPASAAFIIGRRIRVLVEQRLRRHFPAGVRSRSRPPCTVADLLERVQVLLVAGPSAVKIFFPTASVASV